MPGQLPRASEAVIEAAKIRDYLLNPDHEVGGTKAVFFLAQGFTRFAWIELEKALLFHAKEQPAKKSRERKGKEYWEVKGPLRTPSVRRPLVKSIWEIENKGVPRLITAYPD